MRVARLLLTTLLGATSLGYAAAVRAQEADAQPQGAAQVSAQQAARPAPEMQALIRALSGRWTIHEKFELDEWTPNGGNGEGEETWRAGPGGVTFMEEIHDSGAGGEL